MFCAKFWNPPKIIEVNIYSVQSYDLIWKNLSVSLLVILNIFLQFQLIQGLLSYPKGKKNVKDRRTDGQGEKIYASSLLGGGIIMYVYEQRLWNGGKTQFISASNSVS